MISYAFRIQFTNGKRAYADTEQRAGWILNDAFGQGEIQNGPWGTSGPVCICQGHYRHSTAPDNMTGHYTNTGQICCPHVGHKCGRPHGPVVYGKRKRVPQ